MNRRRLLLSIALIGSFVGGAVVGGAIVFLRTVRANAQMLSMLMLGNSGSESYVRYRYGSYSVAKAALLQHAEQLTSTPLHQSILGEAGAQFDVGLTYGRLALAAERAGQPDEAAQYMARAVEAFRVGGKPIDEAQVRRSILQLDAAWDRRLSGDGPPR